MTTSTKYTDTGLTLEIVPTSELTEGDFLLCHGALMQLGKIQQRANTADPQGGAPFWSVQGNNRATWHRVTNPDALILDHDQAKALHAHAKLIAAQDGASPWRAMMQAMDEGPEGFRVRLDADDNHETIADILASDLTGRFDISPDEAERIAAHAENGEEFVAIWQNESWWRDEGAEVSQ